jgi:D-alanyl-D-alanine carboxypeptidase/D-alanyl-D-alanine-endopeptidase (penicillin-binding protein 4)
MKYTSLLFLFSLQLVFSQNIASKLETATKQMMNSTPAFSANLSLYIADENGNLIYEYNGNKGLSTASTQKIFTAASVCTFSIRIISIQPIIEESGVPI